MKKSTWIVLALAVILGLVYWVTKEKEVSVGIKQISLPSFVHETIDRIEIDGKGALRLEKSDDQWFVIKDAKKLPADAVNVKGILDAASEIRGSHYVTNLKEKSSELGFVEPDMTTVRLFSKDAQVWELVLGNAAGGQGRYAKSTAQQDDIYVVRGSFWGLTRNSADDFRDRTVWSLSEAEAKEVRIIKPSAPALKFVKAEGQDEWSLADGENVLPPGFRIDKAAVQALVKSVFTLSASGFVDEIKDLSSPALSLAVVMSDKEHKVDFYNGAENNFFVKRDGVEQIFSLPKYSYDRFNKSIDELRDLSIVRFDKNTINSIVIKLAKSKVELTKKENLWSIVEPKTLPKDFEFDSTTVEDALTRLSTLSAERVARAGKDLPVQADWQKNWVVELTDDKGEKIHLYTTKNKANKDENLVKGNIDQEIYVIKSMRISNLISGIDAFKKEDFELPPIDERTKGFDTLPVDIQRKLIDATKNKK